MFQLWRKLGSLWKRKATGLIRFIESLRFKKKKKDEADEFMLWAFGKSALLLTERLNDGRILFNAWNELHGDLYRLELSNGIANDLQIMKKHYKDYKNGLHTSSPKTSSKIANISDDTK